jgi:hypothetical protein
VVLIQTTEFGGDITGDVFIAKLNPLANTLMFSTFLGGSGEYSPTSIEIDSQRNIYIAGLLLHLIFQSPLTHFKAKDGNRDGYYHKI